MMWYIKKGFVNAIRIMMGEIITMIPEKTRMVGNSRNFMICYMLSRTLKIMEALTMSMLLPMRMI